MAHFTKYLISGAVAFGILWVAAGPSLAQSAPTGTVDVSGPSIIAPGATLANTLAYSISGSGVSNAKITVTFPDGYVNQGLAVPSGVTGSCVGTVCTLNLNFTSGGVSGQATFSGYIGQFIHLDGVTVYTVASLTADYDNGTQQMTSVTDTLATEIDASPAPYIYYKDLVSSQWLVNPNSDEAGLAFDYRFVVYNGSASAAVNAGSKLTLTPPEPLKFVSWTPDPNAAYGFDPVSAPAQWTNGAIEINYKDPLTYSFLTSYVRLWIPCSALPLTSATSDLAFDGTWTTSTGDLPVTLDTTITELPTSAAVACGQGGGATKGSTPEASVGEGENFTWSVGASPPNGAVVVTDAVVVDRIPAKVKLVSAAAPSPAGFATYYCVLPAETGNFTAAQFLSNYMTNGCSTTAPSPIDTVTHLVWYAPTWGSQTDGITSFGASYVMNAPLDAFQDQEVVTNTVASYGGFTYASQSQTFSFTASDTIQVRTAGAIWHWIYEPYPQNIQPKAVGSTFVTHLTAGTAQGWARVKNPTVTLRLPPGLRFVSAEAPNFNGNGCPWGGPLPIDYTATPTVVTQGDGWQHVTWTFGSVANPARLGVTCFSGSGFAPNSPLWLTPTLRVDPSMPLLNGTVLTYYQDTDGDNANLATRSAAVVVSAPAEMRTDVQPDCTAAEEPSLLVTYQNSGGTNLTNVDVTVSIPKASDGSGTEVDTTFVRVENQPAGTTVEYFVDPSWTTTLPVNLGLVTKVRVKENQAIPGLTPPKSLNIVLAVPPATPEGTYIRGSSTMRSDELGNLASANSAPIKVDLCPGILGVHLFFDTDADGIQDIGEPSLPGWDVTVIDIDDPLTILDWTTDSDGNYTQQLSPATYNMEIFTPPADPQATWTNITPPDSSLDSNEEIIVIVPVRCTCDDNDPCTADSCYLGACTFVPTEDHPAQDLTCDGVDDDCDGTADDDYVGGSVTCGDGVCEVTGTEVCVEGEIAVEIGQELYGECTPNWEAIGDEVCDGLDNDCDDLTDSADPGLELVECEKQDGVCEGSEKTRDMCVSGEACAGGGEGRLDGPLACWLPCEDSDYAGQAYPSVYVSEDDDADDCDGEDNDCDGTPDDDFVGASVSCGQGACHVSGTEICQDGKVRVLMGDQTVVAACVAPAPTTGEICGNQADDNCNGSVDEGFEFQGEPCNATVGQGDVAGDECWNDILDCKPTDPDPTKLTCKVGVQATELCDAEGTDENCNGAVNEGYVYGAAELAVGQACDAEGADGDLCKGGVVVCNADENGTLCTDDDSDAPGEDCNGVDDPS